MTDSSSHEAWAAPLMRASVCADLQLGWGSGIQPSGRQDPGSSALCSGSLSRRLVVEICQDRPCLWEQLCTSGGHGCRTPSGIRPAWAPWGLTTGWRFLEAVGLVLIMNFGVKNLSVFSVFSWRIVELQCCINFFYTAKWLSYTYIYILFYIFSIMVYWI